MRKAIKLFFLIIILFLISNKIKAQENYSCGTKIPVGEAMQATVDALDLVYQQLEDLREKLFTIIRQTESAIQKLGKQTKRPRGQTQTEYATKCNQNNCGKNNAICKNYAPSLKLDVTILDQSILSVPVEPLITGNDLMHFINGVSNQSIDLLSPEVQENLKLTYGGVCAGSPCPSIKDTIDQIHNLKGDFISSADKLFKNLSLLDKNGIIDSEILAFEREPKNRPEEFTPPIEMIGTKTSLLSYAKRKIDVARYKFNKCQIPYKSKEAVFESISPKAPIKCTEAIDKGIYTFPMPEECATTCEAIKENKIYDSDWRKAYKDCVTCLCKEQNTGTKRCSRVLESQLVAEITHDYSNLLPLTDCLGQLQTPSLLYDWEHQVSCRVYGLCYQKCARVTNAQGFEIEGLEREECVNCLIEYLNYDLDLTLNATNMSATTVEELKKELKLKAFLCGFHLDNNKLSSGNLLNWLCCSGGETSQPLPPEFSIQPPTIGTIEKPPLQQAIEKVHQIAQTVINVITGNYNYALNYCKNNFKEEFKSSQYFNDAQKCYSRVFDNGTKDHNPCTYNDVDLQIEPQYNKDKILAAINELVQENPRTWTQEIKRLNDGKTESFPCPLNVVNLKALARSIIIHENNGQLGTCHLVKNPKGDKVLICGLIQADFFGIFETYKNKCNLPSYLSCPNYECTSDTQNWFMDSSSEHIKQEVCVLLFHLRDSIDQQKQQLCTPDVRHIFALYNGGGEAIKESITCPQLKLNQICEKSSFSTTRRWECPFTGGSSDNCDNGFKETRPYVAKNMRTYCTILATQISP
jgi:hypothetical protein